MSDYKLTLSVQSWRHLEPMALALKVRQIGDLGLLFEVEREEEPKPEPQVVIKEVEIIRNHYPCTEKGCFFTARSRRGLANHRRSHK